MHPKSNLRVYLFSEGYIMSAIKELTSGSPLKLIFRFSLPFLVGNLLQQTYSLVDAAIVGKYLGINAFASVGASSSVIFLILGFCTGCCAGFSIPVAQKFGARDYSMMRRFFYVGLQISFILSISLAVLTSLYCSDILHWIHTPQNIFHGAYLFLLITFIGIPFTFFYNLLSYVIRALGDSTTPFWFLLFSSILNVILDLLFIICFGWGVGGAAFATLLSQAVSVLLCAFYMRRRYEILRGNRQERRLKMKYVRNMLYTGVPMGLQFSITAIGIIMLQSANNALGTVCIAAYSDGIRLKMFFICPFDTLGMAMATYAGQNYGAGKLKRINQGIWASFLMMAIYAVTSLLFLLLCSKWVLLLFVNSNETAIIQHAQQFLFANSSFFLVLGVLCILRSIIQGVGYTGFAMFSGVQEMLARTLISIYAVPLLGFSAICFGDVTAWIAADLFLVPAYIYVYHRLSHIISSSKMVPHV